MIRVTRSIWLDENELQERFIRASGPGGQNVNKVSSAVQLRFDAARSPALTADVRRRLLALAGRRATKQGAILIDARRFRTQERNREDAIGRLVALIRQAAEPPKPRRPTKPTRAARERRLQVKHRRGKLKRLRRSTSED